MAPALNSVEIDAAQARTSRTSSLSLRRTL